MKLRDHDLRILMWYFDLHDDAATIDNMISKIKSGKMKFLTIDDVVTQFSREGLKILNDKEPIYTYTIKSVLGTGGFGKIFKAVMHDVTDGTDTIVALKTMEKAKVKTETERKLMVDEIKIHRSVDNEHIVKFINFFEDIENVYIVLEYCSNGNLYDLFKEKKDMKKDNETVFTETDVKKYLTQIINGVIYLHSKQIIHNDLKLQNILLDDNFNAKIADFGCATMVPITENKCKTANYVSPERLSTDVLGFEAVVSYTYSSDTWSIGVIMYTMLIGKEPFMARDMNATIQRIKRNMYSFPSNPDISANARDLIVKLLDPVPKNRPELIDVLNDKFFTE